MALDAPRGPLYLDGTGTRPGGAHTSPPRPPHPPTPMPRVHNPAIFNGGLAFGAERAMRQARALSQEEEAQEEASIAGTELLSDSENAVAPAPVAMGNRGGPRLGVPCRRRHRKVCRSHVGWPNGSHANQNSFPMCQVLRNNIQGITKPAIRRLARRAGVKVSLHTAGAPPSPLVPY